MQKSKSVEYVSMEDPTEGTKNGPRSRHHVYEEIKPGLNYMDINRLDFTSGRQKTSKKTESLVKVELDWKRKVRV